MSAWNYTDLWPLLQADILGVLQADAFIGARPGVLIEPGDTTSVINEEVTKVVGAGKDGKNGVGFLVLPIERATDEDVSNPFGPLKLTFAIQFVYNFPVIQGAVGTKVPIRIYAARAVKVLKLYTPVGFSQSFVAQNPVVSEFTDKENEDLRVGHIEFSAREADSAPLARLNRPQISVAGSAYPFTVTVVQPNAATIYYTTDGSHPHAGNPQAQVYSAPVSVTEPGLFRARAFGPDGDMNTIASDTAAQNFS